MGLWIGGSFLTLKSSMLLHNFSTDHTLLHVLSDYALWPKTRFQNFFGLSYQWSIVLQPLFSSKLQCIAAKSPKMSPSAKTAWWARWVMAIAEPSPPKCYLQLQASTLIREKTLLEPCCSIDWYHVTYRNLKIYLVFGPLLVDRCRYLCSGSGDI
jgi:hypothetical protein